MQQRRYCWKWCLLLGPCRGVIRRTIEARKDSWEGAGVQRRTEHGSRGMAITRSHYQITTIEDTAGWERLSVCASYLLIVEISDVATIKCNYELCFKMVNKS